MSKIEISTGHPDAGRVYAKAYDSALAREATLLEELARSNESAQKCIDSADRQHIRAVNAERERDAIQQRLTVAEQGLKTIIKRCQAGWSTEAIELEAEEALEDSALKPDAEGEGS